MDALMPLEVMVVVEALWALVTFERPVVEWLGLLRMRAVHMLHVRSVAAVEATETSVHTIHQRQSTIGIVDIGENGSRDRIAILTMPLIGMRRL